MLNTQSKARSASHTAIARTALQQDQSAQPAPPWQGEPIFAAAAEADEDAEVAADGEVMVMVETIMEEAGYVSRHLTPLRHPLQYAVPQLVQER